MQRCISSSGGVCTSLMRLWLYPPPLQTGLAGFGWQDSGESSRRRSLAWGRRGCLGSDGSSGARRRRAGPGPAWQLQGVLPFGDALHARTGGSAERPFVPSNYMHLYLDQYTIAKLNRSLSLAARGGLLWCVLPALHRGTPASGWQRGLCKPPGLHCIDGQRSDPPPSPGPSPGAPKGWVHGGKSCELVLQSNSDRAALSMISMHTVDLSTPPVSFGI